MEAYSITGGGKLSGETSVLGAKNAVLPLLAACVLIKDGVCLQNCPGLNDIENMLRLLASIGCGIQRRGREIYIDAAELSGVCMPQEISKQLRSSIFMLGPVLGRMGEADFAYPGGCDIGLRPIDLHLKGLRQLGAEIEEKHGHILCRGTLRGARIHLDYPSVGATENIMMAAVCAKGDTMIHNAAREPEVRDLAEFLNCCGASISGSGSDVIVIRGGRPLHGCSFTPLPDRITAGTLLVGAAITGGDVFVRDARARDMQALLSKLREAGCKVENELPGVRVRRSGELRALRRLETAPFPGFPTDMQAQMTAMLTLAGGTSVVQERVFENRMLHVSELQRMGADIQVTGSVAVIRGVERLYGARVTARDLRAGAALCLAGLAAQGETIVENIALIDRGYDHFENMLQGLGGEISRVRS